MARSARLSAVLVVTALAAAWPAQAVAQGAPCTSIASVPYTITASGSYCVSTNLTLPSSGTAISVAADFVVLDLGGYTLRSTGGPDGITFGVYASRRRGITVKNGTISGFLFGIRFDDVAPYTTSQSHLVEDIRADANTFIAIWVQGRGSIVRHNQVVATGGTRVFGATHNAFGIQAYGPGVQVSDNLVVDTYGEGSGGEGGGIVLEGAPGGVAQGNRISNAAAATEGFTLGIWTGSTSKVLVQGNYISQMNYGLLCRGTGRYRDNTMTSVTTPFQGCTDAGGNSY